MEKCVGIKGDGKHFCVLCAIAEYGTEAIQEIEQGNVFFRDHGGGRFERFLKGSDLLHKKHCAHCHMKLCENTCQCYQQTEGKVMNTDFYKTMMEKAANYQQQLNRLSDLTRQTENLAEKETFATQRINEHWSVLAGQLQQLEDLQNSGYDDVEYLEKILEAFRENWLPEDWELIMTVEQGDYCRYILAPKKREESQE